MNGNDRTTTEKSFQDKSTRVHSSRSSSRKSSASGTTTEKPPSVFLCKPRYVNNLPEPPFLLKMYNLELETSQYAKYRISSLENSYKPKLETGPAMGILVDLVTPIEEQDYGAGEPLTADEEEIISQLVENSQDTKRKQSVPSWMRRTGYDEFSELGTNKHNIVAASTNKLKEKQQQQQRSSYEVIQDEFEAAKQVPVHPDPRKRHLKPTKVLPVFPDFENWPDKFVILQFDSNPAEEVNDQETQHVVEEFIENALTVAFTNQSGERFLSYYIPKRNSLEENNHQRMRHGMEEDAYSSEEYELLREYSFVTRPEEGNRSFIFQQDDQFVRYFPVTSKLFLYRRIRRRESSQPRQHILLVHRRPLKEEEVNERSQIVKELCGENDDSASTTNAEEMIRQLEQDE